MHGMSRRHTASAARLMTLQEAKIGSNSMKQRTVLVAQISEHVYPPSLIETWKAPPRPSGKPSVGVTEGRS